MSYLIGVVGVAILFGYATNFLVDTFAINIDAQLAASNELLPPLSLGQTGIALAVIIAADCGRDLARNKKKQAVVHSVNR